MCIFAHCKSKENTHLTVIEKYILETTKQMHAWILQKFSEKTKH